MQESISLNKESSMRKVALTSLAGTSIEWYDFFLYGAAAALVFPTAFFGEIPEETEQQRKQRLRDVNQQLLRRGANRRGIFSRFALRGPRANATTKQSKQAKSRSC